jgi:hypothetical protein
MKIIHELEGRDFYLDRESCDKTLAARQRE